MIGVSNILVITVSSLPPKSSPRSKFLLIEPVWNIAFIFFKVFKFQFQLAHFLFIKSNNTFFQTSLFQ